MYEDYSYLSRSKTKIIVGFLLPLLFFGSLLLLPEIPYVAKGFNATSSGDENIFNILITALLIAKSPADLGAVPAWLDNYRIFFGIGTLLALTTLLYPVMLWHRVALWNLYAMFILLIVFLFSGVDFSMAFAPGALMRMPFFLYPMLFNLSLGLLGILFFRLYDPRLLDTFFVGFFPFALLFYPVMVAGENFILAGLIKQNGDAWMTQAPDFRFFAAQVFVFWMAAISAMYNKLDDELPVILKRELDEY